VLARRGHTEGAVELARLAGLQPAAVLCELMNPDGTMARGDEVQRFSAQHRFPVLTIDELVAHLRPRARQPGIQGSYSDGCAVSS
jgi:3,4-dihydroxy 2-butanone 4-phosphate synthase